MARAQTASSERRLVRVLRGECLTPPPIWLMRQAGRYLPEYRAVREEAGGFLDLCYNPDLAAAVTLQPIERYGFDAAILFADILLIPQALGQTLWFETGEGPRLTPLAEPADIDALTPERALEALSPIFETVSKVRAALPAETALIGFAGAPWTVATYMIAGRGTKDQEPAKLFAYHHPEAVARLLSLLADITADYLCAQVEAGAEVLQIFDTWAGGLSPELMELCVFGPTSVIVSKVKARHPQVPIIGFPRGVGPWLADFVAATGVTGVSLGTGDAFPGLIDRLPKDLPLQGGLDPLALRGPAETWRRAVDRLLSAVEGRPYIFNLGHGITQQTPPETVAELVRYVRGEGR